MFKEVKEFLNQENILRIDLIFQLFKRELNRCNSAVYNIETCLKNIRCLVAVYVRYEAPTRFELRSLENYTKYLQR